MAKTRIPLEEAQQVAENIVTMLAPACLRIEIAGSIRRQCETVGDIEIVAIPKPELNLFGEPSGSTQIDLWFNASGLTLTKDGPRYKQWAQAGTQVDLFLAEPDNWGYILMLRTGPWQFSRRMVSLRTQGGLRPPEYHCEDGYVWRDGGMTPVRSEELLFRMWDMEYIAPERRE